MYGYAFKLPIDRASFAVCRTRPPHTVAALSCRQEHFSDLREFHRLNQQNGEPLGETRLASGPYWSDREVVIAGTQRTDGLDHEEYFSDVRSVPAGSEQPSPTKIALGRTPLSSSNRCINGPDEHRLITVTCKPIGKFQPKDPIPVPQS